MKSSMITSQNDTVNPTVNYKIMLARYNRSLYLPLFVILAVFTCQAQADWRDLLNVFKSGEDNTGTSIGPADLTNKDITSGLKQALSKGVRSAVKLLGRKDGFLSNPDVKIPMPDSLRTVEEGLRKIGQDKYADQFIETMNRAAEQAVPEAMSIFAESIKAMTIDDAKSILQGQDDAATQYFRRVGEQKLKQKFLPVVKKYTDNVGVTNSYKNLVDKMGIMSGLIDTSQLDLDEYVTDKAMDGLFSMIAAEEKKIRENPAARTTELLQKVFSSI